MTNVPNEKVQSELLSSLAKLVNVVAEKAKTAVNEFQPLGVPAKIGKAGEAIGSSAALGVQQVVIAKKSVGFFFKSIGKAYKDTREACIKADKVYKDVLRNVKAEVPKAVEPEVVLPVTSAPTQEQVVALKEAVEAHKVDVQND